MSETLARLWSDFWRRLESGATEPGSAFRWPVLAAVGLTGGAEARTVALRAACRERRTLDVYTDVASAKVAELGVEPRTTLLFWDPAAQLQLRARVEIEVITGAEIDPLWRDMPAGGRINYGGRPPTGTPLPAPLAYDKVETPERLALLRGTLTGLDAVSLVEPHRRALFAAGDAFAGTWLAP